MGEGGTYYGLSLTKEKVFVLETERQVEEEALALLLPDLLRHGVSDDEQRVQAHVRIFTHLQCARKPEVILHSTKARFLCRKVEQKLICRMAALVC